eukprot:94020-Pleurochrysis_carterae.AAC.2
MSPARQKRGFACAAGVFAETCVAESTVTSIQGYEYPRAITDSRTKMLAYPVARVDNVGREAKRVE